MSHRSSAVSGLTPARAAVAPAVAIVTAWVALQAIVASGQIRLMGFAVALGFGVAVAAAARRRSDAAMETAELRAELDRFRGRDGVDQLTGVANREAITAEIERRLATARPGEVVGVLIGGLDRLGAVNDAIGHRAGDEVLAVAARRLSRAIRDRDAIGRFAGDHFVVVSSGLPARRDLCLLADRLLDAQRQPTALADGSTPVVTLSVGIAAAVGPSTVAADELLRDAGVALGRAKREGGDRFVVVDEAKRAAAVARLRMEQELREAIAEQRLDVHYQPIVDAGTGSVDRVEALVRWPHPDRGSVLPGEFLPVAAESNLIVDLGRLVLDTACRQAVDWTRRYGRPITVAVNVAGRQLLDLGLVDTVTRALAVTGLPAGQLELEVSEDVVMDQLDRALLVLRQLDLLGVRLAIDDFGTSRASLGRLKQLAMVSTLKLDREFVIDIGGVPEPADRTGSSATVGLGADGAHMADSADRAIVGAVVALATTLGMSVVAEGVETSEQATALRDLGVDHLQGFLFQRPGPAETIDGVIEHGVGLLASS